MFYLLTAMLLAGNRGEEGGKLLWSPTDGQKKLNLIVCKEIQQEEAL